MRGGRHSRQGHGGHSGRHNKRTPFANYGRTHGVGGIGQGHSGRRFIPQAPGVFAPKVPIFLPLNAWNIAVPFLNTVKSYANWNVCYFCKFDVEDGHTSVMCHKSWRKPNHQEGFTCANAQD